MFAPEHNSARASSTTIMKFTHVILMFALVGGATARAVPVENARLVAPGEAPLVMQLSEDFLAEATASLDAVGAHKLPYSNPSTGDCMEGESSVSIGGLPGAFCSPSCGPATPCPKDTHFGATAEGQCVLETPGHTREDITTLVETDAGTVALTHLWWTASSESDPRGTDLDALHQHRARVLERAVRIVPGHGPAFDVTDETPR